MKSHFLKIAALFIVPVSISLAATPSCNNATIKGHYALIAHGVQGTEPVNAVRTTVFDGKGHFKGAGWWIVNGIASAYSSEGSYTVLKDCSMTIDGTLSDGEANTQFGLLVNGGKKIFAIRKEDSKNFSIIYERQ